MWGLTLDTIQSLEVVLSNGTVTTASAQKNGDLFWVRGILPNETKVLTSLSGYERRCSFIWYHYFDHGQDLPCTSLCHHFPVCLEHDPVRCRKGHFCLPAIR